MKQSTNYNMNKPDPNDMFSLEHWNQNTDKIDETLAPTFEDYTGETPVPTTDEALKNIKSKTKLSILMQNIKAFCKGCCTLGMLVDNCVTNNNNLPLAASQGKILMDQITSLNSDLQSDWIPLKPYLVNSWEDNGASLYRKIGNCYLIKLSVRYGNYETDLDICRNLPFSGAGVCTNCFYNSSEVGNAIQVSGNRLFIVRTPIAKMDTIFANFIVGPNV